MLPNILTGLPSFSLNRPMGFCRRLVLLLALGAALQSCRPSQPPVNPLTPKQPVPVKIDATTGMTRGGQPYFVKGAGGSGSLKELASRGGNSIRTWSTNGLQEILDEAQSLGMTVSAGIWLEPECSWFSYANPEHRAKQTERVRKEVLVYRNHPALLAWGIGNEVEGDGTNVPFWQQLDSLALMVKEIDPAHPTFTALAGASPAKVEGLLKNAPSLDFLGINTYGGINGVREHLKKSGWTRPWMLTEWGPRGFWESPKSSFGAPIEQTSSEKAIMMDKAYRKVISNQGGCLGSYAFVWGWKFEATASWFGLFTHDGATTASVDTLQEVWSNTKPANRAPSIEPIQGVPKSALSPGASFEATVQASDPEGDPLYYHWAVLPELQGHRYNKLREVPDAVPGTIEIRSRPQATIKVPTKPGIYRLYLWVKDGSGHAATANMPLEVR